MKINLIQPISCGNAVRLVVNPTVGETRWRLLRKESPDITSPDDPSAFVVHDGAERFLTDARLLVNGVTYHYALYGWDGTQWLSPATGFVTPQSLFTDPTIDAQELVRERIDVTLHAMMARGLVALSKPSVPVMSIPFYQQGTDLPVVTVLFGGGSPAAHALGNMVGSDEFDGTEFVGMSGWHQSVSLEISAWSLNAQERNALRVALTACVTANLDIFESLGLSLVELQSVQDSEDFQSMNVPVYQTVLRLGCQVVVAVTDVESGFAGDILFSNLGV